MLPGRLGGELAGELSQARPDLAVLFVSAHPKSEIVRLGHLPPDATLLEKPCDERALAGALAQARAGKLRRMGEAART